MNTIKKLPAVITAIRDLTPTAKELTITPSEPLPFIAGQFVNLFLVVNGTIMRRAYSISSPDTNPNEFTLSIRRSKDRPEAMTPHFWAEDYTGATVEIMGPLGTNTADKLTKQQVFLFGFGIGAGVVKSLAAHILERNDVTKLVIMTGNRAETELVHHDYFDSVHTDPRVTVRYVVSDPTNPSQPHPVGFIQNHIGDFTFNNADVYMCGQTVACDALQKTIESTHPEQCNFFVEAFH